MLLQRAAEHFYDRKEFPNEQFISLTPNDIWHRGVSKSFHKNKYKQILNSLKSHPRLRLSFVVCSREIWIINACPTIFRSFLRKKIGKTTLLTNLYDFSSFPLFLPYFFSKKKVHKRKGEEIGRKLSRQLTRG